METTINTNNINIDGTLMAKAQKVAGSANKSKLMDMALRALIERECRSAIYLAQMGGTQPHLRQVARRRPHVNSR